MVRPDELGAHMSIAGGLPLALERGHALGCFAVQIFVKNQRQWAARPLPDSEARAFRAARRATAIPSVFAHGSYLVNLACPDPGAWTRSSASGSPPAIDMCAPSSSGRTTRCEASRACPQPGLE